MSERRALTPTLLAIVLGLEGAVVFFAALTAFGLKRLDAAPAFIGGAVLMVVYFVAAGLVRRGAWAQWLGWALQAVLLATGIVLLPMLAVGAIFVALWIWSWVRGRSIDRATASGAAEPQGGTP